MAPQVEGRNPEGNFHAEKRSNSTHASTTDSEAGNDRKSGAVGAYLGHTLMENRNGLMVDAQLSQADGYGERDTAHTMLARLPGKLGRRA